MMFSGRSMGRGGGGGGGGSMLRTLGRAVTRVGVSGNGIQEPFSSSSPASTSKSARRPKSPPCLSVSSPVNCHSKNPVSGLPFSYSSFEGDDFDWVAVDGFEDESFNGFSGAYVLGNVPSEQEVDDAVFALQKEFCSASHFQPNNDNCGLKNDVSDNVTIPSLHVSTDGSETDWKEPSLSPYDTRMRRYNEFNGVYSAFQLLQTEPTVQKMVKSLATDKAVWDAVMNNEAVRELRESLSSDNGRVSESSDETSMGSESHSTTNVVMWIFDSCRAKFMELIEKITKIVTDLFQPAVHKREEGADLPNPFTDKLRTSFMLSIIVLLVVVVNRARRV
ncbi:uncharacterized protein LOC114752247 [Neltuma alba]|uniref:uncharacterized protein LOC114752247 n=1 Tax=Neltuma alba TaxID=207710 RepID=UPI0010A31E07|nr:uncharacterized protein LOC114752247 [Prosopis alba]